MAKRYELAEWQYRLIEDLLPRNGKRGGRWKPHRELLNGMFWVLNSGAMWREMPERYGSWKTVYWRFCKWRDDGTFQKVLDRLHLKLNEDGTIDLDTWYADSTVIRASRAASGARKQGFKKKPSLWRAA